MVQLSDVLALLEEWYPPATADSWDAVGLVCGDPDSVVRSIHLAVDPSPEVVAEAVAADADLLLVHHPMFLRGVHGIGSTTPKGRSVTSLIQARCALLTAHTNADQAVGGVSHALADALGLRDQRPLRPTPGPPLDALGVYVPVEDAPSLRAALAAAGAGRIGDYGDASFSVRGQGRFRPLEGARPTIGVVGEPEVVEEERLDVVLERSSRASVVREMVAAHPYEEPAHQVVELADVGLGAAGTGRIGEVPAMSLREFAQVVADALPQTAQGVRVGGDPERVVRRVAVCGGAGDFLLDEVRASGADVFVTSDLRHHPAAEFLEHGGPALVDVAHWAAEWTWLPVVAGRLAQSLGATVGTRVSTLVTDPWTFRVVSPSS